MQVLDEYRGYTIVETDWCRAGGTAPALVVPGLKDRLGDPLLLTLADARAYIDAELAGREDTADMMAESFEATLRTRGGSLGIIVPADAVRRLGLDAGDVVGIVMRRA